MLLSVYATIACTGIRQDEYLCENAVSHLVQCCPRVAVSSINCTYTPPDGCNRSAVEPDIAPDAAECILHRSCEELQADGACDHAGACP